jgi:hypothetical protein
MIADRKWPSIEGSVSLVPMLFQLSRRDVRTIGQDQFLMATHVHM